MVVFENKLIEMESVVVDYSIKSKDREFQFQGELLAQEEAQVELVNEVSCQMSGKTYSIEDGGYVCSLEFLLSDQPNDLIVLFEEIDLTADVEKFFYVFEPAEIFKKKAGTAEEREQVAQNCKKLGQVYEKMVFALLDQFQTECECRGPKDKPKPEKTKSSLWSKLGIK